MFVPQFFPVVGGAERQAELLAQALLQRGASVEVLTLRQDPSWPIREVLSSGVVVHRVPYLDLARRFSTLPGRSLVSLLWLGPRLSRVISSLAPRFELFHAHNASAPITAFAIRAARWSGLRTILKLVNIGERFDLNELRAYGLRGRLALSWLRRDVDRWIAISEAVRDELIDSGIRSDHIVSVSNGVIVPDAPRQLPDRAAKFLHIGRIDRKASRDFEGLIAAFEQSMARTPGLELAMVGGGDRLDEIRTLTAASAAAMHIRVPGSQEGDHWRAWADAFVQPSFFEGMSNALLEAMACGLACIAYDIPPNREALANGEAGILVPPGDRARLSEAIVELATRPGAAREWGARARRRASTTYDVDLIAARLETMYRGLVGASGGQRAQILE